MVPTRMRGLREPYGSWKMICASRRLRRNAPPLSACRFSPSNHTSPLLGSSSRNISRPSVDFPQPDSPTMPRVSPPRTLRLTSVTACTNCFEANRSPRTGKRFVRWRVSTRVVMGTFDMSGLARAILRSFPSVVPGSNARRPVRRVDGLQLRIDLGAARGRARAAVAEMATRRQVQQIGNDAGDGFEAPGLCRTDFRHRPQQSASVRMERAREERAHVGALDDAAVVHNATT